MNLVVEPLVGAGPFKLGLSSARVRALMGEAPTIKRGRFVPDEVAYHYFREGVEAILSQAADKVLAYQFFLPSNPVLFGLEPLTLTCGQCAAYFAPHGLGRDDHGLISTELGLAISHGSFWDALDEVPESVAIAAAHYWT